MKFDTLFVSHSPRLMTVRISRPNQGNSINAALIQDLNAALDQAEHSAECRTVVLEGEPGLFCTGMDFAEVAANPEAHAGETAGIAGYMKLLQRFTLSPKIIVAKVDGKVIAGGVGLVAASDFVIASPRAEFSLSEALWGLLPCCVIPFLVRRIGFQKAYAMTFTTRTASASEALGTHLVDELTENLDDALRKLALRLNLLEEVTICDLKNYFSRMWAVTPEMERLAVDEITRLAGLPRVQQNIENYVKRRVFPWERRGL